MNLLRFLFQVIVHYLTTNSNAIHKTKPVYKAIEAKKVVKLPTYNYIPADIVRARSHNITPHSKVGGRFSNN